MVEVWIGTSPIVVGDRVGPDLYREVYNSLRAVCTDSNNGHCRTASENHIAFKTSRMAGQNQISGGKLCWAVNWTTLLIELLQTK